MKTEKRHKKIKRCQATTSDFFTVKPVPSEMIRSGGGSDKTELELYLNYPFI